MSFYRRLPKLLQWVITIVLTLFILMTVYRFFFFYHYRPTNKPFSGSAFILGLRFDARIVCVLGLAMLILCIFRPLNPFKNAKASIFWNILLTFLFLVTMVFYVADFYHYDYLKERLNASDLNFLQDAKISANMMWETYPIIKIVVGFVILLVLVSWLLRKLFRAVNNREVRPMKKRSRVITYTVSVLLMAILIFGKVGQYPLRWSDAYLFADDFKSNTALNPFQSFLSSLSFKSHTYNMAKVKAAYPLMADYLEVQNKDSITLNYTRNFNFPDTFVNKPNVVLVICESFSAYKSSMFGNHLDPTPYFNSLCNSGAFFTRSFSSSFGTARGIWATITGIPDIENVTTSSRIPAYVDQHSIINDFKNYEKFYFLGGSTTWANIQGVLNNNIAGLHIYEQENFKASRVDVWGISDKNLFLEANKVLAAQTHPFFSVIQTADNHRPYTIPDEDLASFKKVNYPDDTLKKYGFDDNGQLNAFRYTDFCFQKFIEAAKKEKYFDNTIFVFVGDHGLRGDAGDMFPQAFTKQSILAEHVPLLFYSPKLIQPMRIVNPASQVDILPSIATLARQPYSNTTMGKNLFDTSNHSPRYAFISDPSLGTIGVVSNQYYYSRNLKTNAINFVSVINNEIPVNDSAKNKMSALTEAWYETARYLLLNNKKK